MDKKEYFGYEESEFYPGKYTLSIKDYDGFLLKGLKNGSYGVIFARLLNLDYPSWLRCCRDLFGAELIGKNSLYVVPYFKRDEKLVQLVKLLNVQANLVMWMHDNPDWREHEDYLKEKGWIK